MTRATGLFLMMCQMIRKKCDLNKAVCCCKYPMNFQFLIIMTFLSNSLSTRMIYAGVIFPGYSLI